MRFVNTIADDKHMVKGNIYQVIKHKVDKSIYYSFHNDKVYRKDYIYSFDDIYYLRNYPKLKLTGHTITNKFLICLYNNVDLPNIKNVKKIPKQYKYLNPLEPTENNYQTYYVTYQVVSNKLKIKTTIMSEKDSINFIKYRKNILRNVKD